MPASILRLRFAALFAFGLFVLYPRNAFLLDAVHAPRAEELGVGLVLAGLAAGTLAFLVHERALGWAWLCFLAAAIATSFEPGKQGSREYLWLALAANFQPGWFPSRAGSGLDCVFYDGTCALCHGFVRFVLAEDPQGTRFRFAPLESDTLRSAVPETERARLPDSIVVLTGGGELLVRSRAVLHVLRRLGGWWRLGAEVARLVPRPLADLAYTAVAALRKRVFGSKEAACPLLPRHLRARFDS
jgi:predicted DCC family thiol-disulfide oxidoreductase YuxK